MSKKWHIFLTGGLACVMPNIVEFGAKALKSTVPFETVTLNSIIVIFLGGIIFIAIAGFLVTYIFGAKNMKDAFYKGIAVPTLIISLANGMTATKTNVASIPTAPVGDHALYVPAISERSTPLIPFFINKAYAENGQAVGRGTVEFRISPSDLKDIKVTIMDDAGNILGEARSDTTRFKLDYFPGRYKLSIEANSFYTEVMVQIRTNQITPVAVGLKERGFPYQVYQGIEKLMKR